MCLSIWLLKYNHQINNNRKALCQCIQGPSVRVPRSQGLASVHVPGQDQVQSQPWNWWGDLYFPLAWRPDGLIQDKDWDNHSQLTHPQFHLTSQSHHRMSHLGLSRGWWSPREPAAPYGKTSSALVRQPSVFSKTCFRQSIRCSHVIGQAPPIPGYPAREHVWFPSSLPHFWGEKRYKDHSHSQGMAHLRSAF